MKILITFVVLLFTYSSFAQNFRLNAGLNLSNYHYVIEEGNSPNSDMLSGYHLGCSKSSSVSNTFYIEPELLFASKGMLYKRNDFMVGDYESSITTYNLDLNVPVVARFTLDNSKFYAGFGPSLSLGLAGNIKETINGDTEKEKIIFGSESTDDMKRFDFGLTASLGFRIYSFEIGARYGLGLVNLFADVDFGVKMYNRVLSFSIGYYIKGKD